jgi:hypothetical protein
VRRAAPGWDVLGLDFGTATPAQGKEVVKAGGVALDCNDGGSHVLLSRLGVGGKARDLDRDADDAEHGEQDDEHARRFARPRASASRLAG